MRFKSRFTTQAVAAMSFCLIGGISSAAADILHVPGDFPTIQEAIDAAVDGDEVVVADGIYTGDGNRDIDFGGKLITVRSENGPDSCVIDCEGTFNDAHRGFYFHSGETAEAQVQGFTITNGRVAFPGGGGMYILNSSPTVADCVFTDNFVVSDGSDVYGGAMYNQNSSPSVTNCAFINNTVFGVGREDFDLAFGGGMANLNSNPIVADCTFIRNIADSDIDGGAGGGGMYNSSESNPLVISCAFIENWTQGSGGGMQNSSSNPTVTNCAFSGNYAAHGTGGLSNYYSSPMVTNCTFIGNDGWNSGMSNGFSSPTVTNCTFISGPGEGWAMANGSGSTLVTNCIFWGGAFLIDDPLATTTVNYSDVQGGWGGAGSNNIDANPLFVGPGIGDYHLLSDSPCIDAANNTAVPKGVVTDLDGNSRFIEDPDTPDTGLGNCPIVDMGAYEFRGTCPWDLDCNGSVGASDLLALLADWGNPYGAADLLALLADWGACP